jgi:hypothetical protein
VCRDCIQNETHQMMNTAEDRDGSFKSGMDKGAAETMDRFAELLLQLQKRKHDG